MVNIYTLSDPKTGEIRYIGQTTRKLIDRWYDHCSEYKLARETNHKRNWIVSLKKQELRPKIEILDIVEESNWIFWEQYWISQFKSWGYNLTNLSDGGEGNLGGTGCLGYRHTEEAKANISRLNSRPKTESWILNAGNAKRKTTATPIIQFTKEGIFVKKWTSFFEAAKYINVDGVYKSTIKNIHACCKKKRKTAYNFKWEYESIE
jgi:hypothetical protein